MNYDELRTAQNQLFLELKTLRSKILGVLSEEHYDEALKILENIDKKFDENHLKLLEFKKDPTFELRGYFSFNNESHFKFEYSECLKALQECKPGTSVVKTEETNIAHLERQLRLLTERLVLMEEGSSLPRGEGTTQSAIAELLLEMKAARVPLKFPSFPKESVYKRYREWRSAVNNFEKTNAVMDSVKIQHLKEACKGTDGDQIVSLFSIDNDSFSAAMEALDKRFLVSRIIVSEYIGAVINIPTKFPKGAQSRHLKEVIDTFNALTKNVEGVCRESLAAKGIKDPTPEVLLKSVNNALYLGLMLHTLDDYLKTQLASTLNIKTMELPEIPDVIAALEKRLVATQSGEKPRYQGSFTSAMQLVQRENKRSCFLCPGKNHSTSFCRKLQASNVPLQEKLKLVKNLCWVCLEKPYSTCECKKRGRGCDVCGGGHHRILCNKRKPAGMALQPKSSVATATTVATVANLTSLPVLGTMLLKVKRRNGSFVTLRALVDDGSMISYITTSAAQTLGCHLSETFKTVKSVDGKTLSPIRTETILSLQNIKENLNCPFILEEVAIIKKIPLTLPSQPLQLRIPEGVIRGMGLADPTFGMPNGVDILIGARPWALMKLDGSIFVKEARLQKTIFGFVVQGAAPAENRLPSMTVATIVSGNVMTEIKNDFRKIFEYEPPAEENDEFAEQLFMECHKRLPSGQYEVPLIFGAERELGDSYNVCFKRNQRLLAKLTQPQVNDVLSVLKKYRDDDIISICENNKEGLYYSPFVLVWRNKATTPLRICLDASQKTTNGLSANDIQLVGSKLQPDLSEQLLKFRKNAIAITADVSQMYLNILIRPDDRKFQRSILVLPDHSIQEIEYNTVLFGATCAPFLAQRVVKQLAIDEKTNYPIASTILESSTYIDDIIYSVKTIEDAKLSLRQVIDIMNSAKFHLHKISSNRNELFDFMTESEKIKALDKEQVTSVLGVQWDHQKDTLSTKMCHKPYQNLTKRQALSKLAAVYDPIGIIAPVLMTARFLIQRLWISDRALSATDLAHAWDREVPHDIAIEYLDWYNDLQEIDQIKIPRWVGFDEKMQQQIFTFADASILGYGAVSYLRTITESGVVSVKFITSKGKVAPINSKPTSIDKTEKLSIPRLELMAALLGAELSQTIRKAWGLSKDFPILLFTDSEIVLAQISSAVVRDVFTENRLRKIRALFGREHWFHVATQDNPADVISRGCSVKELMGIWTTGPELIYDSCYSPVNKFITDEVNTDEIVAINVIPTEKSVPVSQLNIMTKFSSFKKTVKIMAWVKRAIKIMTRTQGYKRVPPFTMESVLPLSADEILEARNTIIRAVQQIYYNVEIKSLMKGQPILNGPLRTKNAFLDESNVLRIGSRIQLVEFDYDERNPIVLPPVALKSDLENHLSYQVIFDSHLDNMHGGVSSTMCDIKQRYHVPNLRSGVKNRITNCQSCARARARVKSQIMGNLPKQIVVKNPAFFHVTLDYAGPIKLKTKKRWGRGKTNVEDQVNQVIYNKAWIMLVACFTSGAYHLELVSDLTANAFIRAFESFISTRGSPNSIRSDNASTFHRAKDMIKEVYAKYKTSLVDGNFAVQKECALKGIQWSFNPPLASHFGGKHERGIRSVREKLRKSIGLEKLSFEDMHATLKRIEGILNSRPLMKARGVFEEGDFILTPGHFLIGRPINMLPTCVFPTKSTTLYEAYKVRVNIENRFWEIFHKSHLQEIAHRSKWYAKQENLEKGDLVLLYEDNTPPLEWRKGVVVQASTDNKKDTRVVKVRTAYGEFERPIAKLVLIPGGERIIEENDHDLSEPKDTEKVAEIKEIERSVESEQSKNKKGPKEQPIRRSKRLANRNLLVAFLMCLMIPFGICSPMIRVNSSHGGGVMVYEKETVMINNGIYHLLIETSHSAYSDAENVMWQYNKFWKYCDDSRIAMNIACGTSLFDVREKAEKVLTLISEITLQNVTYIWTFYTEAIRAERKIERSPNVFLDSKGGLYLARSKREKGWFWRMLEWAFSVGSNDANDDLIHERSAGVIVHTVDSVKQFERTVVRNENLLKDEFNRLYREFDNQKRKEVRRDISAIEAQISRASNSIMNFFDKILAPYTENAITDKEIMTFVESINLQTLQKGAKVAPLQISQLRRLINFRRIYNRTLSISCEFPLVSFDIFKRVVIIPFPDKMTNSIINFDVRDIIIDKSNLLYLESNEAVLTKINGTLSILNAVSFKRIQTGTPCVIKLVVFADQKCKLIPLPKEYDYWYETPLHNIIQFASSFKKSIFCPNNKTEILDKFGVLTIQPQCTIRTESSIIRATLDEVRITKQMAKITFNDIETLFNQSIKVNNNTIANLKEQDLKPFVANDDSFNEVINEAISLESKFKIWEIILISISATLTGCFIVLGFVYCKGGLRCKRQPKVRSSTDQNFLELQRLEQSLLSTVPDNLNSPNFGRRVEFRK